MARTARRASSPSAAATTGYPSPSKRSWNMTRSWGSSSTTRIGVLTRRGSRRSTRRGGGGSLSTIDSAPPPPLRRPTRRRRDRLVDLGDEVLNVERLGEERG